MNTECLLGQKSTIMREVHTIEHDCSTVTIKKDINNTFYGYFNSRCQGCTFGKVVRLPWTELPMCYNSEPFLEPDDFRIYDDVVNCQDVINPGYPVQ